MEIDWNTVSRIKYLKLLAMQTVCKCFASVFCRKILEDLKPFKNQLQCSMFCLQVLHRQTGRGCYNWCTKRVGLVHGACFDTVAQMLLYRHSDECAAQLMAITSCRFEASTSSRTPRSHSCFYPPLTGGTHIP